MKNLTHEIPTGKQSILLVKDIAPSGTNRTITDKQLAEMTESVRTHGVIQPLVVRSIAYVTDERLRKAASRASHVLVAGERRWRSARTVGLENVQVVIRELSDREALELLPGMQPLITINRPTHLFWPHFEDGLPRTTIYFVAFLFQKN
jgi:hypothetical protein